MLWLTHTCVDVAHKQQEGTESQHFQTDQPLVNITLGTKIITLGTSESLWDGVPRAGATTKKPLLVSFGVFSRDPRHWAGPLSGVPLPL